MPELSGHRSYEAEPTKKWLQTGFGLQPFYVY